MANYWTHTENVILSEHLESLRDIYEHKICQMQLDRNKIRDYKGVEEVYSVVRTQQMRLVK